MWSPPNFSSQASASGAIKIKAPIQAENGAVVPFKVETDMSGVESIAVSVEKNPRPLATSVDLSGGATGYYSTRIKMGKTSKVTAFVKAGGGDPGSIEGIDGVDLKHQTGRVDPAGCEMARERLAKNASFQKGHQ